MAQNIAAKEAAQLSLEEPALGETNLTTHYAIIKSRPPQPHPQSAMKKVEDSSTLVFTGDVWTSKHQIKQAVRSSRTLMRLRSTP